MPQHNREIRVFISSTFSDMREERKYLNTKVFPELRSICQQRSVVFTEVDLQWGIDEDKAKQGGAVEICLEEINRCQPYFIGLMGERYGWSPQEDGLDVHQHDKTYTKQNEASLIAIANEELRKKVGVWIKQGESVTAMEIIHGVLDSNEQAEYSYFYFRDKTLTQTLLEQEKVDESLFFESKDKKKEKLKDLKNRILAQEKPWHVCEFNPNDSGYVSIEQLGSQIRADLLKVLDEKFPEDKAPSALEKERNFHAAFARSRLQSYIPDQEAFQNMFKHIQTQDTPLAVSGKMGSGKSALLANFADRWRKDHSTGLVIEHYAGSGGEADVLGVMRRVMNEIKHVYKVDEDIPSQPDDIFQNFASWLFYADKPLLLVLDGINQLQGDLTRFLYAFPANLNEHVHIISSSLDGEVLDMATKREWHIQYVQALTPEQKNTLVVAYLKQYHKSLAEDLVDKLVNSTMGDNPLFLRVVMDELRVDATHDQLEAILDGYLQATDLVELFTMVLTRCERVYSQSHVPVIMALIYTSRYGLSESELREICDKSSTHPVAPLYISQLIFGLGGYLADREGLYGFMHDALRIAVKEKYIQSDIEIERRKEITAYFVKEDLSQRQLDELPWQWSELINEGYDQKDDLQKYLARLEVVEAFSKREQWEAEMLGYWNLAQCDRKKNYDAYIPQVHRGTRKNDKQKSDLLSLLGKFYQFLGANNYGEILFAKAQGFYRRTIEEGRSKDNRDEDEAADAHLADLLERKAINMRLASKDSSLLMRTVLRMRIAINDKAINIDNSKFQLAQSLCSEERYEESERLYRELLDDEAIQNKSIFQAEVIKGLAIILCFQSEYERSESFSRSALSIAKRHYNESDTRITDYLSVLSRPIMLQGKLIEAEKVCREVLKRRRESVGEGHPLVATSCDKLAEVLALHKDKESLGEAQELYIQTLEIRRKKLEIDHPEEHPMVNPGDQHPDTIKTFKKIIQVLEKQGKREEALQWHHELILAKENVRRHILERRKRFLGEEHQLVAASCNDLAEVLIPQEKFIEAEGLLIQALEILRTALGDEHPNTKTTLDTLKEILGRQGKDSFSLSHPLGKEAFYLHIIKWNQSYIHDEKSMVIGQSFNELAKILIIQEKYAEAEAFLKQGLDIYSEKLGVGDHRTRDVFNKLVNTLKVQGKHDDIRVLQSSFLVACQT